MYIPVGIKFSLKSIFCVLFIIITWSPMLPADLNINIIISYMYEYIKSLAQIIVLLNSFLISLAWKRR